MARDFVDSMLFLVDRGEIASEAAVDVLISTISEANSLLSAVALGSIRADLERTIDDFRQARVSRDYTVLALSSLVRSAMAREADRTPKLADA